MSQKLRRGLGFLDSFSLVVGSIIGTGVFLKTAGMSQTMGSPGYVLLAWVTAGLLSIGGALAYAEISSLFPSSGGEYAYLRKGYGNFFAFLYGWTRFWVASPATIAAYAAGAATFLAGFSPAFGGSLRRSLVALSLILVFSVINCLQVSFGGRVQSIMTLLKIALIVGLGACLFVLSPGSFDNVRHSATDAQWPGWSAFGTAVLAALWAYDGWNNLPMVGSEVRSAEKNLPRALVVGILAILGIYAFVNLGYFYALPFETVVTANSTMYPDALPVSTAAAQTFLGASGIGILSLLFVFSAVSAMNGSIMTSARVPFAMAEDGLFVKALARVNAKTHVPVTSILVQAVISGILVLWGTFDQLTDYVVFSSWIFYALVTSALFLFRRQYPDAPRTYKVWGYPFVPAIFLVAAVGLLVNTIITMPRESGIGLCIILAGLPVYYGLKGKAKKAKTA